MEFSHWDFRPKQRQRFVGKPGRKVPFLRILLLLALGGTLYWQFDNLISITWITSIRESVSELRAPKPESSPSQKPGFQSNWSNDSTLLDVNCPDARKSECVKFLDSLHSGLGNSFLALSEKAKRKIPVSAPYDSVSASIRFPGDVPGSKPDFPWPLSFTLRGANAREVFSLQRFESGPALPDLKALLTRYDYCSVRHGCLRSREVGLPMPKAEIFQISGSPSERVSVRGNPVILRDAESPAVFPALPGKLVDIRAEEHGVFAVKLYHGRGLFTYYGGLSRLHLNVKMGSILASRDTLGFVDSLGGKISSMAFSAEEAGRFVDPMAFLNVQTEKGGVAHGP